MHQSQRIMSKTNFHYLHASHARRGSLVLQVLDKFHEDLTYILIDESFQIKAITEKDYAETEQATLKRFISGVTVHCIDSTETMSAIRSKATK